MGNDFTILLVDDDETSQAVLQKRLDVYGWKLLTAANGVEALVTATKSPPDLVILDIDMPKMDGFEVCRQIRASGALQNMCVIFLSGMTDASSIEKAFDVGGDDFIAKPYSQSEIVSRIQKGLRKKAEIENLSNDIANLDNILGLRDQEMRNLVQKLSAYEHQIIDNNEKIIRVLEFTPGQYDAGMTILNAFSDIVRQRQEEVKISIKQEESRITFTIEVPHEKQSAIYDVMSSYSLLLSKQISLQDFESDPIKALRIEHKLKIAELQLDSTQKILEMEQNRNGELLIRQQKLEDKMFELLQIVNRDLVGHREIGALFELIESTINTHDRVLQQALRIVETQSRSIVSEEQANEIIAALETIQERDPRLLKEIAASFRSISSGVFSNYVYSWLSNITSAACL